MVRDHKYVIRIFKYATKHSNADVTITTGKWKRWSFRTLPWTWKQNSKNLLFKDLIPQAICLQWMSMQPQHRSPSTCAASKLVLFHWTRGAGFAISALISLVLRAVWEGRLNGCSESLSIWPTTGMSGHPISGFQLSTQSLFTPFWVPERGTRTGGSSKAAFSSAGG